jgi:hypothetical protein
MAMMLYVQVVFHFNQINLRGTLGENALKPALSPDIYAKPLCF